MWQDKAIQSLFEIEQPIIQAPMAGSSSAALVAAVSNAGGLGSFGAAPLSPHALASLIDDIRSLTDRPFNINLFASSTEYPGTPPTPGPVFSQLLRQYHEELGITGEPAPRSLFGPADAQLEVLIAKRVPVISFHFGIEAHQIKAIHQAGLRVMCSATSVEEALALETLGVDVIIAQGSEAGGHRGSFLTPPDNAEIGTLALLPQIVDRVTTPVIAAGGIMDGRGIVAAAALGAAGVQMGTAFLGCEEIKIADVWRDKLRTASATDTVITRAVSGKPARGIRNRYIEEVESLSTSEPLLPYPLHYSMSAPLRKAAATANLADFTVMWSGQGVGLFREDSAANLMRKLLAEIQQARQLLAT